MIRAIGERFKRMGRMLPGGRRLSRELGGARRRPLLPGHGGGQTPAVAEIWASRWEDLADFEIIPVLTSQQFWAEHDEEA